jgi:hypothetical protein
MKADAAFGRVGFEIRGGIANLKGHHHLLSRLNSCARARASLSAQANRD